MMTGSYVRSFDLTFAGSLKDHITFDLGELREHLKKVRIETFQLRAYYKGLNGNEFRERLERLIHTRGVDAPKLAERIGVSTDYVEAMCRENIAISNPSIKLVKRLARQLDVPVSYLIEEKQPDHILEDSERAWRSWLAEQTELDGRLAAQVWDDWKREYAQDQQVHSAPTARAHRLPVESVSVASWEQRYRDAVKRGQSLFGTA
jgi:transcriptional regulator with XRE-family HTH domain